MVRGGPGMQGAAARRACSTHRPHVLVPPQTGLRHMSTSATPTRIRYRIIGVTMVMSFILYLDRICMGEIVKSVSFNRDLGLSKESIGQILGSFFFAYALFQVP